MVSHLQKIEIKEIGGLKILDSRGNPTIEVKVKVEAGGNGVSRKAAAPSGASRGKNEVVSFPEKSVDKAIDELNKISKELENTEFTDQSSFDDKLRNLDGTENLRNIGGNTIVALSIATAKAVASISEEPLYKNYSSSKSYSLPYPLGNVLGGGEHAGKSAPDIQEFLTLPLGAESFVEAAFANSRVHQRVKDLVNKKDKNFTGGKSDEGAWAPNISDDEALETVTKACEEVSDELGFEIRAGLDVAASSLYDEKKGKYEYKREKTLRSTEEQMDLIVDYIESYDLAYVEDPIEEEDFETFAELTQEAGDKCLICGDDLFVTNVKRIKRGMEIDAANAVLIKPNQIGTLTATKNAVELSKENDSVPVISHRSGETTDNTIAHLAVAMGCPIIKTGVVGGERIAKLNELIRIEKELGNKAKMDEI